jgi:hypothetical protein
MPETQTRRGWLVRELANDEVLEIRHPDRPPLDLVFRPTALLVKGSPFLCLSSRGGVQVYIPVGQTIEPVPGVLLCARSARRVALRSENHAWASFARRPKSPASIQP